MSIYWILVLLILLLGMIMPQEGKSRKRYIVIMCSVHAFVCGFKYMYLTGDLRKYASIFYKLPNYGLFSPQGLNEGSNPLWSLFMNIVSRISGGDFQLFLILIAFFTEICVAFIIYRHSTKPWFSYLVWDCMSFYIYGFSAIKQAVAMAIILIAGEGILENSRKKFYLATVIAGLFHFPAFALLPAYWITKRKISKNIVFGYLITIVLIFLFRVPIVNFMTSFYYEDVGFIIGDQSRLGGRFIVLLLIVFAGVLLKGFDDNKFNKLFLLMGIAAVFQLFSMYDNIFTRFADYYLQFSIIYIPMLCYDSVEYCNMSNQSFSNGVLQLGEKEKKFVALVLVLILVWWYWKTCLGNTITYDADNYLNFRFMWDVQ